MRRRIDPIFKGSGSYVATKDNNSAQRPKDQRQFALKSFNFILSIMKNITKVLNMIMNSKIFLHFRF